jgi:hypothetical protein
MLVRMHAGELTVERIYFVAELRWDGVRQRGVDRRLDTGRQTPADTMT